MREAKVKEYIRGVEKELKTFKGDVDKDFLLYVLKQIKELLRFNPK